MKLKNVIGRSIKEIWVRSRFKIDGFDHAQVAIKLNNEKIIDFPWDLEVENIESTIPIGSKEVLRTRELKKLKGQIIKDVIVHSDECGRTGFFELTNGVIIFESTMFPSGVMNVGLKSTILLKSLNLKKELILST